MNIIIDSGSTTNIIDFKTYKQLFSNILLEKSNANIYPYNATKKLPLNGYFKSSITANNKTILAKFFVTPGQGGCLLGQKTAVKLDLLRIGPPSTPTKQKLFQLSSSKTISDIPESTKQVIHKHSAVFKGMGKVKNFKQRLHINSEVTPIQQPTRRIPFHTRQKISAELDHLLKLDIIERVDGPTSWISQIVAVPKKNGKIRLCIDMRHDHSFHHT